MGLYLKKILFNKSTYKPVFFLILSIYLYVTWFFWYIVDRIDLCSRLNISENGLALLIIIVSSIILIAHKSIDSVFYNKNIKNILIMPINCNTLYRVYLKEVLSIPFSIATLLFFVLFFYKEQYLSTIKFYVISVGFICLISTISFIVLLALLKTSTYKNIGYLFVVFKYINFLTALFLFKNFIKDLLSMKESYLYSNIHGFLSFPLFLPIVILLCLLTVFVSYILFNFIFVKNIYKIFSFEYAHKTSRKREIFKIKDPYIFLEIKRYFSNKDSIFYFFLQNIIVSLFILNYMRTSQISYLVKNTDFILLTSISSLNSFSTTSYSLDFELKYILKLLPIKSFKIFKSKVLISFLLNEMLIFFFILVRSIILNNNTIIVLLLYGTLSNFLFAFIGVLLDYLMPRTAITKTEYLHGNLNKLITIILALFILHIEVFIDRLLITVSTSISTGYVGAIFKFFIIIFLKLFVKNIWGKSK